jgi:hypothetical protein
MFEALHDTARPAEAAGALHQMLRDDGSVLLADERGRELLHGARRRGRADDVRVSISHCLPAAMAINPPSPPARCCASRPCVTSLVGRIRSVDVLPIENDFFRFYRLRR